MRTGPRLCFFAADSFGISAGFEERPLLLCLTPPPLLDGMERRTVITDICNSPEGGNGSRVILGIFTEKLVLFLFSEILRKEGR